MPISRHWQRRWSWAFARGATALAAFAITWAAPAVAQEARGEPYNYLTGGDSSFAPPASAAPADGEGADSLSNPQTAADFSSPRYGGLPETREYQHFNFSVELPGDPWHDEAAPVGSDQLVLALIRRRPEVLLTYSCERVGLESYTTANDALLSVQANLASRNATINFTPETSETVAGMQGLRFESQATGADGGQLRGIHWAGVHNGYAFSISTLGTADHASDVALAYREGCLRFRMLDAARVHHVAEQRVVTQFESPRFGYRVNLTEMGWIENAALKAKLPGAEFAATHGSSVLMILPLPLPGRAADLDMLLASLVERMQFAYPGPNVGHPTAVTMGGLTARQVVATRQVNSLRTTFVFRAAANANFAYLVLGWTASGSDPTALKSLEQAMNRIEVNPHHLPKSLNLTVDERRWYGLQLNEVALAAHHRGDLPTALEYFNGAYTLCGTDEAIFTNRIEVMLDLNQRAEALAALRQGLPNFPGNERLRALEARVLTENGDPAAARTLYRELFVGGYIDEEALERFIVLCKDAGAYDEAIEALTAYVARKPTLKLRLVLASLHGKKGDHDRSIAQFQALRKEYPSDLEVAMMLAFAYENAERYADALQVTQPLIDAGCRDETIWILHGRNQLHLDQHSEAKQTFERALALNPQSGPIQELLKIASNQLGEGENSPLKQPITPVEFPTVVREAIAAAPVRPATLLEMYGAEEQVRITGVSYHRGKPLRTTTSCRVKLHTAGGVARYSTLTFDLSPTAERLFVNRLVVLDEQGRQVAEGAVSSYYLTDDNSNGMVTNGKVVNIPVPGLKPGRTIEYMVTREQLGPAESFGFEEVRLSSQVPVGVRALYIEGDVQDLKYAMSQPLPVQASDRLIHCVVTNPLPYQTEARQPAPDKFMPIVWVGDAKTTWNDEAHRYLAMIAEQTKLDDPTQRLAIELTKNCRSKREKLAVLAAYVQSTCTYQGIEFGRRGRVPNAAGKTLELRYGDCKDHALLLRQLLAAAAIPAHLTVVNAGGAITTEVASLDQFNHMVLFVPNESIDEPPNAIGGLIVDATEKEANPLLFPPYGLSGKPMLVLDGAHPRIVTTPAYPPDALQLDCRRKITVQDSSSAGNMIQVAVVEDLTFNDYMSPAVRGYLRNYEVGKRREAIQKVLSENQHVRVSRADTDNLENTSRPLALHLEYVLPDAFHCLKSTHDGSTLVGTLPSAWETYFLEAEYLDTRETPFEIKTPRLIRSSLAIELPTRYQVADIERLTAQGQTPFVAWATKSSLQGPTLQVNHVIRVPAGQHAASEYQTYYADMKSSLAVLQLPLLCREGTTPAVARSSGANPH